MERLIFAPIELFEERYSVQWLQWFINSFSASSRSFEIVGSTDMIPFSQGEFLDIYTTNTHKAQQVIEIIHKIKKRPGDSFTLFLMDAWFPGLEAVKYAAECAGTKLTIKGMIHAGLYDPHDFLHKKLNHSWALKYEKSLLCMLDEIFVATEFHINLIQRTHPEVKREKFTVVPWPVFNGYDLTKENIVVFPHRLADEKAPHEFELLKELVARRNPYKTDIEFIRSKDVCRNKNHYYELLARSKVVFSSARQETFGIAMQEGINCGCIPVAPNRLSYPETMRAKYLYKTLEEAADMVVEAIHNYEILKPSKKYGEKITWINQI